MNEFVLPYVINALSTAFLVISKISSWLGITKPNKWFSWVLYAEYEGDVNLSNLEAKGMISFIVSLVPRSSTVPRIPEPLPLLMQHPGEFVLSLLLPLRLMKKGLQSSVTPKISTSLPM